MSKKWIRLKPEVRKTEVLDAAIRVANENNYYSMQRVEIATEAGCSEATVTKYFGTMGQLKKQVLRYALKNNINHIVAQGILQRDAYMMRATTVTQRQHVIASLIK